MKKNKSVCEIRFRQDFINGVLEKEYYSIFIDGVHFRTSDHGFTLETTEFEEIRKAFLLHKDKDCRSSLEKL